MQLLKLSAELIDHIFAALLDVIGPPKTLRLRVVNGFFNDNILRAVIDSYIRDRNGPFHFWLDRWIKPPEDRDWFVMSNYRRVSPPMMCRFIEAEIQSDFVQPPLSVLRDVRQTLDEVSPAPETERRKRARQIYEAAADYLDWDQDHKFALSWHGTIPRRESSDVDEKKQMLLGAAVITGNLITVRNLLQDNTIDVNYEDPFFGRPLQSASRCGHVAVLELLLSYGADPLAVQVEYNHPADHYQAHAWGVYNSSHGSALQVACLAGHVDIVRSLLRPQNGLKSEHLRYALAPASRGGHIPVLQVLLDALPDLDMKGKGSMLLVACRQGRLEVVKMMIGLGVRPHYETNQLGNDRTLNSGPKFAAMRGYVSILRLLIENLHNICNDREELLYQIRIPMQLALRYGHLECVEALFNVTSFGDYHLSYGLIRGAGLHVILVRLLVRLGVNLNLFNAQKSISLGEEAILYSVEMGLEPVVRVLLELGVPPNSPNQNNHPVLRAKVYEKHAVLKTLLEFGGEDIDLLDSVYAADVEAGKIPYRQKSGIGGRQDRAGS